MESSSSSVTTLQQDQISVNCSMAPMMTLESNRPFFIAVCTEIICELDPIFIAEHYDDLSILWYLQDGNGNCHEVHFNNSISMPFLTEGWHQFRQFYNITTNPLMSYTYLGNSMFQIKIFKGSTTYIEYPRYHRLTTSSTRYLTFQVYIPDTSKMKSKLILPSDIGDFLRVNNHGYVRLCGRSNTITTCQLLFNKYPQTNTKVVIIGSGWKDFCSTNRIRPDTTLDFKCDSIMAKNIVFVI